MSKQLNRGHYLVKESDSKAGSLHWRARQNQGSRVEPNRSEPDSDGFGLQCARNPFERYRNAPNSRLEARRAGALHDRGIRSFQLPNHLRPLNLRCERKQRYSVEVGA